MHNQNVICMCECVCAYVSYFIHSAHEYYFYKIYTYIIFNIADMRIQTDLSIPQYDFQYVLNK